MQILTNTNYRKNLNRGNSHKTENTYRGVIKKLMYIYVQGGGPRFCQSLEGGQISLATPSNFVEWFLRRK